MLTNVPLVAIGLAESARCVVVVSRDDGGGQVHMRPDLEVVVFGKYSKLRERPKVLVL